MHLSAVCSLSELGSLFSKARPPALDINCPVRAHYGTMWPTEGCVFLGCVTPPHGQLQLQLAWGGGSCVRSVEK